MEHLTLRSTAWDGPPPQAGDVVQHPTLGLLVVHMVAEGAGVGHWRLECHRTRVIAWAPHMP